MIKSERVDICEIVTFRQKFKLILLQFHIFSVWRVRVSSYLKGPWAQRFYLFLFFKPTGMLLCFSTTFSEKKDFKKLVFLQKWLEHVHSASIDSQNNASWSSMCFVHIIESPKGLESQPPRFSSALLRLLCSSAFRAVYSASFVFFIIPLPFSFDCCTTFCSMDCVLWSLGADLIIRFGGSKSQICFCCYYVIENIINLPAIEFLIVNNPFAINVLKTTYRVIA